jgi:23S rRNA (cytidine1920-2'-O)/16S rRNA (cytidine1409-2'-O)-methyltransferase
VAKQRIDRLLVERGLAPSRNRAQSLILAGRVLVRDRVVDKVGTQVPVDVSVRIRGDDHPYVGRGGLKLAHALDDLELDPTGLGCLDLGSSTGGFTDCLLQRGASWVVAVDVGTNQLDWRLRTDPRVICMERRDARSLRREDLPGPAELVVMDLSFIGLAKVLPAVPALLLAAARVLALVKPQFEVGPGQVGKGGVVRDPELREEAVLGVIGVAEELGLQLAGRAVSRLPGARGGNVEEFVLFAYGAP